LKVGHFFYIHEEIRQALAMGEIFDKLIVGEGTERRTSRDKTIRPSSDLTTVEQHALLAVLRLYPNGYGVSIRDEIKQITGRAISFGTIYAAMERLESKGFVTRREGEPTAERGGRRKLHFTITAPGQLALKQALESLDALRAGTSLEGKLAPVGLAGVRP
jgi:DNA-binding PadR family transcriptional regulator